MEDVRKRQRDRTETWWTLWLVVRCNKLTAPKWSKPLKSRETTGAERVIGVAVDGRRNSLLFREWTLGGYIGGRVVFEEPHERT
jgi:hypothetical protein